MQVNYNHLYYFWVTATEGGISRAAEKLHLAPQTVSAQIAALEERLGRALFIKRGRTLALTEFGALTKSYADEMFHKAQEWLHTAASGEKHVATMCRVGLTDGLPKTLISKWLSPALDNDQHVLLDCQDGNLDELLAQLTLHKLDMILTDLPLIADVELSVYCQNIGYSDIGFFAPMSEIKRPPSSKPKTPLSSSPSSATSNEQLTNTFPVCLHQKRMVMPGFNTSLTRSLMQWFEVNEIKPDITVYANDIALMKSLGRDGFGMFPAPLIIKEEIMDKFHVGYIGKADNVTQEYHLITPQRSIVHPFVAKIVSMAAGLNSVS
ncbi:LysR family transcriptional regulator [Thalassotalea euphylliae]|uniref:LysR family transcriptional regulator n=1 Tax=Thalassotalea euphylliae TaxID=1655234 RepID=A0A3E0TQ74_9GAMM|nr:LysR family transcriptional regulator [Thalassotalea euphylliae]REL26487.1 LysR family transcriptional regulator [Thalassotalea euphylliae]